jgi:hypothetical protein
VPISHTLKLPLGAVPGLAGILAAGAGGLLYAEPKGPDVLQGAGHLAGAFLLFLFYLFAQLSWGGLLARLVGREAPLWERFFLGSALATLLPATLGFLPVVGAGYRPVWMAFLLLGCVLSLLREFRRPSLLQLRPSWPDLAVLLGFALALASAFAPHAFWDSLWYHLTASRYWFEAGRVHLPDLFPVALKTGIWDYHFLLGQVLLGGPDGGGLIAAQLFGQWASVSCAFFSYLVLRSTAFALTPFAVFAGILGTELFFVAPFAKNDWAAVFYGLAAAAYFLEKRGPVLVGAAAGLAFAAKLTTGFFLLPLLALQGRRCGIRGSAFLIGAFLALASPLLLRNLYFTGNPFFPALSGLFSAFLGPSWSGIEAYEGLTFSWSGIREKLTFLARDNLALAGLLLLPFACPLSGAFLLLSLPLFFFFTGPKAEWRLLGPGLVLGAAFGALALERLLGRLPRIAGRASLLALGATLLYLAPLPWSTRLEDPSLQIRSWISGSSLAWLRLHGEEGLAATLNEQRIYYLFPRPPLRAFDLPRLDRALAGASDTAEAVAALRQEGVRYLVLSAEFLDRYHNRRVVDWMYELSEREAGAVVFREQYSRVLDLERVR